MVSESGADETALYKSYANVQRIDPKLAKPILKEAKEVSETSDAIVLESVAKDAADEAKQKLEEAGAVVTLT